MSQIEEDTRFIAKNATPPLAVDATQLATKNGSAQQQACRKSRGRGGVIPLRSETEGRAAGRVGLQDSSWANTWPHNVT